MIDNLDDPEGRGRQQQRLLIDDPENRLQYFRPFNCSYLFYSEILPSTVPVAENKKPEEAKNRSCIPVDLTRQNTA
jgi:hypothetical protein